MAREIYTSDSRGFVDHGWLKSHHTFSFSSYHNPQRMGFGLLRVINDDTVAPSKGFATHSHSDMEIISIPLSGSLRHQDSMGNKAVIKAGDVQRMSAGTGLTHSEFNLAYSPVHFYQIWIFPDQAGLKPSYDQRTYDSGEWKNRLFPVASGQNLNNTVTFHTDATIYRCALDPGAEVSHSATAGRRIFVYLTEGRIAANGAALKVKDQARVDIEEPLVLKASQESEMILIDVPSCKGWGYSKETLEGDTT